MEPRYLPVQNFTEDSPANEQSQSIEDIVPDPLKMAEIRPQVLEALGTVFDPEIPVNIRDMGLIYDVLVDKDSRVGVRMTLTAPACPAAQSLPVEVREKAAPCRVSPRPRWKSSGNLRGQRIGCPRQRNCNWDSGSDGAGSSPAGYAANRTMPAFGRRTTSEVVMARFVFLLLVTALGVPASVLAQAPEQAPSAPATVDVSKLGVDLSRIKRELDAPPSAELSDSALKMSFTVQVIGVAPKIDFLRGFAIDGPIPYGAPTHRR